MGPLRLRLQRIDQSLAERLTHVLYSPLFHAATDLDERQGENLVRQFVKVAEPLPIDPRWNRLWAMVRDHSGDVEVAERSWREYLDDVKTSTAVRPEDRERARALVLLHMGEEFVSAAEDLAPGGPGPDRVDPEVIEARRKAVEYMEESLRLCPTHRPTYVALKDAHDDWNEPERAIEVSRRLLRVFPDDFEILVDLAKHEFRQDRPAEALEHIERARKLRPLDENTAGIEWAVRVALARHLALESRWEEGRAQFEAAGRLRTEDVQPFAFAARRAVFELKAGQPDRAEELIAEAQKQLVDPTPLWLALLIEARRYKLPKAEQDRFEDRWEKGLAKKGRGDTAGALADLIGSFLAAEIVYPGAPSTSRRSRTTSAARRGSSIPVKTWAGSARSSGSRRSAGTSWRRWSIAA